ncbi:hypothetical protein FQR65_LT09547 [Abscondita terminalis]|nr:hypothetical protein FQR65_LT09547 [Abscondita terminalis]
MSTYRRKDSLNKPISEVIEEWPLYKHSKGDILVEIDFKNLFPGKSDLLFSNWTSYLPKSSQLFSVSIKDRCSKNDFSKLIDTKNENSRDYFNVKLLHCILKPCKIINTAKNKGTKNNWKPSIVDSQYSQFQFLTTVNDLQRKIEERRNKYKSVNLQVQPFIIVIGEDEEHLSQFYVWYENIIHKFETFLKSLDYCFKIFHCFNFVYPPESELVWTFIQKYFYNINLDIDNNSPVLSNFITSLNARH